jgi:sigma-B regulation protein RsbU (phosphoserine phosphatase)
VEPAPGAEPQARLEKDHPLVRSLAGTLDPVLARDLAEEPETAAGREASREALRALRAEIAVPIHLPEGGETLGFLLIGPKLAGGRFGGEEVGLLSMLGAQIAFAVRNARLQEEAIERRLMDEEIARARSVQESIVPRRSEGVRGADVAAVNLPSRQVGGDYYDLVPLGDGGIGIAVGDVSGKGFPAALLMSMLHAALHVQMNGDLRADALLGRLNRILCRSTAVGQFATFFFGVYRRGEGELRFCNGGHNPPFILRADGSVDALAEGGTILGFLEDAPYVERSAFVGEGDLVVFYTDGVTEEARDDDEQFGEERLVETVRRNRARSAREIVAAVEEEVARFAGRDRFADDFTLIVLRGGAEDAA